MKVDVLLGLQWGDEGKGKIVDVIASDYDIIARFQGGPNAGHSLEFNNVKHVLHSIPSGIFHEDKINIIGNGVVIDPVIFKNEIIELEKLGVNTKKRLFISRKAHLILPTHQRLDAASETKKGVSKIGSTLKGIGPTYMDKTGRNGLRIGDIEHDFQAKYDKLADKHRLMLSKYYDFDYDISAYEREWFEGIDMIKEFLLIDSEHQIGEFIKDGKKILAEGAQGTLLDIDFGTYPFVTSSNTVSAGACIGLGIAPNKLGEIHGIFKAYCTRVGSGPFPTELFDKHGEDLQNAGNEFGATTGRPRRCGWLDLPALKYAVQINGVTKLIMTKADVLGALDTLKVAVAYKIGDSEYRYMPYDLSVDIEPIYKEFKSWDADLTTMKDESEFPVELMDFINFIESETGVPISIVSVGPDRKETIFRFTCT